MKRELIAGVLKRMLAYLDNAQLVQLKYAMETALYDYEVRTVQSCATECASSGSGDKNEKENNKLLKKFIASKRIEGCSEKTLKYYRTTLEAMFLSMSKSVCSIQTEDLRLYLTEYQKRNQSGRVTIDNIRRIFSSFFAWLEDEDYIVKSPVRRIHKVKTATSVKETYTDEELERMRDHCDELRDLAIIDMLASTGMRIGEMVLLNRRDINFAERECVVFGKGDKERVV